MSDPMVYALELASLTSFWRAVEAGEDRLELLRKMADVVLRRSNADDIARERSYAMDAKLSADRCFVCRTDDRPRFWHHVIQLQHGGSQFARNQVSLCHRCHAAVHPWLDGADRKAKPRGWSRLGE